MAVPLLDLRESSFGERTANQVVIEMPEQIWADEQPCSPIEVRPATYMKGVHDG